MISTALVFILGMFVGCSIPFIVGFIFDYIEIRKDNKEINNLLKKGKRY